MRTLLVIAALIGAAAAPALAQQDPLRSHWEPGKIGPNGTWIVGHRVYATTRGISAPKGAYAVMTESQRKDIWKKAQRQAVERGKARPAGY